jgi:hypothetical protein
MKRWESLWASTAPDWPEQTQSGWNGPGPELAERTTGDGVNDCRYVEGLVRVDPVGFKSPLRHGRGLVSTDRCHYKFLVGCAEVREFCGNRNPDFAIW